MERSLVNTDHMIEKAEHGWLSLDEFRAFIDFHAQAARRALHDIKTVPSDLFDVIELHDHVEAMDQFLMALGRNERKLEDQEQRRERTVLAKRANNSLEKDVERVDFYVQKLVEVMGSVEQNKGAGFIILPMNVDFLIGAFLRLLDHVPASAFAEDRLVPQGLGHHTNPDIIPIIELMRNRKRGP